MRDYAMVQRPSSVGQLFPLNDFFSTTTWPISTEVGRKHAWGMGIQICSNKEAGPIRGKKMKNFNKSSKKILLMIH